MLTILNVTVVTPTICYTLASILFFLQGDNNRAVIFGGYAVANLGFLGIFK